MTHTPGTFAMQTIRLTLAAFASFATLALTTTVARADHYGSAENLAAHVQSHSRDLYTEIRHHVGYGFSGRHLLSDTAEMYRLAVRIRSNAHAGWNLNAIARDARQLDRLTHHMRELIDDMDHGHGHHKHGSELRHITKLLRVIEDDVHELLAEVERLQQHASLHYSQPGLYLGGTGISVKFIK